MAAKKQDPQPETTQDRTEPASPSPRKGEPVEVDLTEPEGDEEPDDDVVAQPSRQEKKRERQTLRQEAEAARQRAVDAERTAGQAIGYARGVLEQQQRQQQGAMQDPNEAEAEAIFHERELLVQEYQLTRQKGALTPEQERDFKRRGFALERRLSDNSVARRVPQQQQQDPVLQVLQVRYPEVMSNQRAFSWAMAKYQSEINDPQDPAPQDWNTVDRIINETREKFGLGGMQPPAERQQRQTTERRYAGSAAGAAGGRGESSRVTLSPEDVAAADAAYEHLPQKERYQRYARVLQAQRQKKAS